MIVDAWTIELLKNSTKQAYSLVFDFTYSFTFSSKPSPKRKEYSLPKRKKYSLPKRKKYSLPKGKKYSFRSLQIACRLSVWAVTYPVSAITHDKGIDGLSLGAKENFFCEINFDFKRLAVNQANLLWVYIENAGSSTLNTGQSLEWWVGRSFELAKVRGLRACYHAEGGWARGGGLGKQGGAACTPPAVGWQEILVTESFSPAIGFHSQFSSIPI